MVVIKAVNGRPLFKMTAMALFNKGSYRAAVKAFKQVLAHNGRDDVALFYLALSLYEIGEFRQSLRYWERLKQISPAEKNIHLNMGCAYQSLHRNDLAINCFKKELKLNPLSREALYSLGTLYYNLHKYKCAVSYLERCYALKHSVEQIIDRLAYSYFKTRQIDKEIVLCQDWLRAHPDDTWCLNNLGAAFMHAGEYNRAQIHLQKAALIDPKDERVARNIKKVQSLRRKPTTCPL